MFSIIFNQYLRLITFSSIDSASFIQILVGQILGAIRAFFPPFGHFSAKNFSASSLC